MPARRPPAGAAAAEGAALPALSRPALSRRHAAGAPSARGLLLTLLGEFVLTGDGTAWTSAVLATFARLGIGEKTTRQARMRTAARSARARRGGPLLGPALRRLTGGRRR